MKSFPGAVYKGFATREEALEYAARSGYPNLPDRTTGRHPESPQPLARREHGEEPASPEHRTTGQGVVIYADGGSINNPGPGGYGVIISEGNAMRELSGGFRHTTNNRMELTAVIEGLKSLEGDPKRPVSVYTDSRYVVDGMSRGGQSGKNRAGCVMPPPGGEHRPLVGAAGPLRTLSAEIRMGEGACGHSRKRSDATHWQNRRRYAPTSSRPRL